MDRDKVIKGLECCTADLGIYHKDHFCDMCPYKSHDPEITFCFNQNDLMRDALELLKAQEPKWISVKDRLPENDDKVLCCSRTAKGIQNIIIGYYMGGMWRCGMNSNVTHWMPLPEPPKEG